MTPEIRVERSAFFEMEINPYPGLFIDIEGLDGSGESTQVARLGKRFREMSLLVHETSEPIEKYQDGEAIRMALRKRLIIGPRTLQTMFTVNRSDHLDFGIEPRLEKNISVIIARYLWSTVAFGSLEMEKSKLLQMNQGFPLPDLSFFLKVSPEECLQRRIREGKKLEYFEELEKMKKIWPAYEWLNQQFPEITFIIDGERKEKEIGLEISRIVSSHPKFDQLKEIMEKRRKEERLLDWI